MGDTLYLAETIVYGMDRGVKAREMTATLVDPVPKENSIGNIVVWHTFPTDPGLTNRNFSIRSTADRSQQCSQKVS